MTITVHTDTTAPDLRVERLEVVRHREPKEALDAAVAPPARAAGRGRLVEGRARDQRHDGRRGPAAARVPRDPHRGGDRAGGALDPVAAASGRHLGELLRRPRRPVDDHRGLRRAAPRRRPGGRTAPADGARVHPAARRPGALAGVHPAVAGAVRGVVLGRPAEPATRDDPPAVLVPVQPLRLGVLGPADRRPADHRHDAAAVPAVAVRSRRAAQRRAVAADGARRTPGPVSSSGSTRGCTRTPARPLRLLRQASMRRGVGVDPGASGGRRLVGRHPAAVGLLDPRPAPDGLPARPPGARRGHPGAGPFPDPRGHPGGCRSAGSRRASRPVWDTGARADRVARRRGGTGRRRRAPGRRLAARRGDHRQAATGRSAGRTSSRAAGRSSSTTTATPTPTTPRRSSSRCGG